MNTKKKEETSKFTCDFCGRGFSKETTNANHTCEYKHRWLNKDLVGNRIAFQSFLQFYKKNTFSKKEKTYLEFIKSAYYTAFVKFGNYCVDTNVLNVSRFVDWLLKNKIKIDYWNSDTSYTKFLIEYIQEEDPLDAIARSIETCAELSEIEKVQLNDVLRYGNVNRICYAVTNGKISPWLLFHSDSGKRLLDNLDSTQVKMILEYINPEIWAIKFKRYPEKVIEVQDLLKIAGF